MTQASDIPHEGARREILPAFRLQKFNGRLEGVYYSPIEGICVVDRFGGWDVDG